MMLDTYKEATALWQNLSDFWKLITSSKKHNLIWQTLIEKIDEIAEKEDRIAKYSIEDVDIYKKSYWVKIPLEQDYDLGDDIVSIPTIVDGINKSDNTYIEGTEYAITAENELHWNPLPTGDYVFAPEVIRENDLIEKYFNNEFLDLDLSGFTITEKKHILRLVWFCIKTGPSPTNIEAVINALSGMPFMWYQGLITLDSTIINMDFAFLVNTLGDGDMVMVYEKKVTGQEIIISDGRFVNANINLHDILNISGEYYHVIEDRSGSLLLLQSLIDGTYQDITVYKRHDYPPAVTRNAAVLDQGTGDIYYIVNKKLINAPEGESEFMMLMGHQHILKRKLAGDIVTTIYVPKDDIPVNTIEGVDIVSGMIVPAFTPIQKVFSIYTWKKVPVDLLDGLDIRIKNDLLNGIYNEEVNAAYHLASGVDGDDQIVIYENALDGQIASGDYIDIYKKEGKQQAILDVYEEDGRWVVKVSNIYGYVFGQNVYIIQRYDPDSPTQGRVVNRGGLFTIISGIYEEDQYKLTLDGDLEDIYDSLTDFFILCGDTGSNRVTITGVDPFTVADSVGTELEDAIDAGEFNIGDMFEDLTNSKTGIITAINTGTNEITVEGGDLGAAADIEWQIKTTDNTFIISPHYVHHIRQVSDISGVTDKTIDLEGFVTASLDDCPIIRKAKLGGYGDAVVYKVDLISGNDITLSGILEEEVDNFVILKDNINPSTLYQVIVQDGQILTLDRDVEYNYGGSCAAIFTKTLPYHNGFIIRLNEDIQEEDMPDIMMAIETAHPNYMANVDKILSLLLPSSCKYMWRGYFEAFMVKKLDAYQPFATADGKAFYVRKG